jgi:hypothetical protein
MGAAGMAKLADAADLKSAGAKSPVGVRFPLPAPFNSMFMLVSALSAFLLRLRDFFAHFQLCPLLCLRYSLVNVRILG